MRTDLDQASVGDLLKLYAEVLEELRRRGVTPSTNNPAADCTEHLVTTKLGLTLGNNSAAGFDAIDKKGRRYQIKDRRLTAQNRSTELSAIRNLPGRPFDFLVAVVYRPDFTVDYAAQVPYEMVVDLAKYVKHTNAYRFLMRRSILDDPRVTDVTKRLTAYPGAAGDGQKRAAPERQAASLLEGCRQERLSRQASTAVQPPVDSPIEWPGIAAEARAGAHIGAPLHGGRRFGRSVLACRPVY
jgi:hypothetical protein